MNNKVILVDGNDNEVGFMDKLEAHKKGLLHRAFSIFVFNSNHELLLQKRSIHKYHSGGLWTNSCCSHPKPGESLVNAASRRLQEELELQCPLNYAFSFKYMVHFNNGLTEHELDHVMIGYYENEPNINKNEVESWKWMPLEDVKRDVEDNPSLYTEWFKIIFKEFYSFLNREQ